MERGQRCEDGKEARKRRTRKREGVEERRASERGRERWCSLLAREEGYRYQGTMEPSNLHRCPRAPFNETRLMQHIDHLGMR